MKLLVVEDDRTVGQYVKRGLEEQQYLADWVGDGAEALRLMTATAYDLIILDLRLPGMTGLEVLRTLRDRGLTMPVPGPPSATPTPTGMETRPSTEKRWIYLPQAIKNRVQAAGLASTVMRRPRLQ